MSHYLRFLTMWYIVCATSKGTGQPAHMHSLIRAFTSHLNILWVLSYWRNIIRSLKGGCTGSKESTLFKMPHCWKSHVTAQIITFVCFVCLTSQVNSYGHGGTVSSPNHTFFLGKLEQAVNQCFVHILLLVTDNNPSWINSADGRRMILEIIS